MTTNKKVQIIRGSKSYAEDILRVAAYCRVSTDSEDQVNSFIAQMHYYYSFIKQAENMELVDVYADEGITGTSVAKRDDFNRMIIFQMYLQGRSLDQIKRHLEENNILTVRGNPVWDKGVIKSMLTNEKYVGDIMFQKTYREDCICNPFAMQTVCHQSVSFVCSSFRIDYIHFFKMITYRNQVADYIQGFALIYIWFSAILLVR